MDAKPQRPRALRVHDENMPPPAVTMNGVALGKTLHQRTKSTPAFSSLLQAGAVKAANKKVLGEVNANIKLVRDDSEVGKASPGKMAVMQEPVKPTATFTRPATRPLAPKQNSSSNVQVKSSVQPTTNGAQAAGIEVEPVKKIVAKKSTKVLREVLPVIDANAKQAVSTAPVHQTLAAPKPLSLPAAQPVLVEKPMVSSAIVQHQEVRKTESVPLREEPAARIPSKPANINTSILPAFPSEQEYLDFLVAHNAAQANLNAQVQGLPAINGHAQYAAPVQARPEQYYDAEEDEYYYDEGYTTGRSFGLAGEGTGVLTTILAPKYTDQIQLELNAAKAFVEATRTPDDIEDEQWDTSMVAEYGDDIFSYMRELETRMAPNPRYMELQQEIQWSMRAVLMDWVVQVHQRFNLLPETLFLTANYIDRFLSCKVVSLGKLQLVGATAIFVAAKYEEVQCPTISEIIYMVDGGYSADELLKAERFMLSMLQFELGWPGPMSFLRRISKADDYDLETRTLAKYFLEVTIMDERFVGCTPSYLAAGAHCMARLMLRKGDWSQAHIFYSNYTFPQLRDLLAGILDCCLDPTKHHRAVFEKYTDKRYKKASTFVQTEVASGFTLPGIQRLSPVDPYRAVGPRLW